MDDRASLDLFAAGLSTAGDILTAADAGIDVTAEITEDGLIAIREWALNIAPCW